MPPYRRNRWIVGGLLRPVAMIAAAYAYTLPVSYGKKVLIFFLTWVGLEIVVGFTLTVFLGASIYSINSNMLVKLALLLGAFTILIRFWEKLPDEEKVYGW
jgi:hypothetical protein